MKFKVYERDERATIPADIISRGGNTSILDPVETYIYQRVHLAPETDPIARAICEKLDIDWRRLKEEGDGR